LPVRKPQLKSAPGAVQSRTFILGAGFSYGAEFPLAWQLLPETFARLESGDQELLVRAIQYLYPVRKGTRTDQLLKKTEIEEFMSLLDMSERFNERMPTTFLKPPKIRELRRKLLTATADLMVARQKMAERKALLGYVDAFVRKLRPTDTVITFNWDILLERRLRHTRVPFAYSAEEGARPRLLVLKLHGSIDWFHAEELDTTVDAEAVQRQIYRLNYYRLVDPIADWRGTATPFIVPPTFFKDVQGTTDLETIWALAFEALQAADEIHICGYRLPKEDMYARAVLRRAIRHNALIRRRNGADGPLISVVNPDRTVVKAMRETLHSQLRARYQGFQDSPWAK